MRVETQHGEPVVRDLSLSFLPFDFRFIYLLAADSGNKVLVEPANPTRSRISLGHPLVIPALRAALGDRSLLVVATRRVTA